jgi:hypothetical protein
MSLTCAEILAIVETSPEWPDFVGDGASIPWEWIPLPWSMILYAWKQRLDAAAPQAFRLHDFCYDLRSDGLGISRDDADLCLYADLLNAVTAVEAAVVYAAVARFGGRYFHQTRNPLFARASVRNMEVAHTKGPSMPFKCTMLFEDSTNASGGANPDVTRVAGWSESWYFNGDLDGCRQAFIFGAGAGGARPLCAVRAACLPKSARISGQRIQQVSPVGPSQSYGVSFPGGNFETDTPFMALLCGCSADGVNKARKFTVTCIPDEFVVQGEFAPSRLYNDKLRTYFNYLDGVFSVKARDGSNPNFRLVSIDATGKAKTLFANPFAIGDVVYVTGAVDAGNNKRSGRYTVLAIFPLTNEVVLQGWNWGQTAGGVMYLAGTLYPAVSGQPYAIRIKAKKVGRPFTQYRGRRSKRKQKV